MSKVLVVSGADSGFYEYLKDTILSVIRVAPDIAEDFDIGVLDCELSPDQKSELSDLGVLLRTPPWPSFVPEEKRKPMLMPRFVRPLLPEIFPGYEIYLWIDADAWVQDARFFAEYVEPARAGALSIVHEKEPAYVWQWNVFKYNLGNLVLTYGLLKGLKLFFDKPVNNGLFGLRHDSSLWQGWHRHYEAAVARTGKFYSQIPMTGAIYLDQVPTTYTTGVFNWITSRGEPMFNPETKKFCTPYAGHEPLSVLHMAGPGKNLPRPVKTTTGGTISTPLRYRDWLALQ